MRDLFTGCGLLISGQFETKQRKQKKNHKVNFSSLLFRPNETICRWECMLKYIHWWKNKSDRTLEPSSRCSWVFSVFVNFPKSVFSPFSRLSLAFSLWDAFVFALAEDEWLSVLLCQNTGDTADACRRRLMRCPASPKPGSSSGLSSRRTAKKENDHRTCCQLLTSKHGTAG